MGKRSFTLNPNNCFIKWGKADSECYFDSWSIQHFYWQGFFFIILFHFFKIKKINTALILTLLLTIIHSLEEYFGNIALISLEGIFVDNLGPIINPRINPKLRTPDNDYLQNSIGDVLAGLISNLLIVGYWVKYGKIPYIYLCFSIVVLYLLYQKSDMLYDPKPHSNL